MFSSASLLSLLVSSFCSCFEQVNGASLETGTTKDAFLELLIETPRPVCIGFRLQKV